MAKVFSESQLKDIAKVITVYFHGTPGMSLDKAVEVLFKLINTQRVC